MDDVVQHVVVVGGGTAGWLTASLIAADHCTGSENGVRVTLIESPRIPILGVGEGTWPSLRDTLRRIGLNETAFIRACGASFKQGSRFDGWRTGAPDDSYQHPFDAPPSAEVLDLQAVLARGVAGPAFAGTVSAQAAVCRADRAPKQTGTPEYAAVTNYAYHLDAPGFAALLARHAVTELGVSLIKDDVVEVVRADTGDVRAVTTTANGAVAGDLFVDCTGARAVLIGEALGAPLEDVSAILGNNAALAVQVPHAAPSAPVASQTIATALPAGWVWDIALNSRRGVGHVFDAAQTSEEAARQALQAYLDVAAPHAEAGTADARLIRFSSAYRRSPWTNNVVAVGMSQGFVEPLEASAIVMIELSATLISDLLPPRRGQMGAAAARYNARCSYRWDRIVDFLKLHYVLSERVEPYWARHRDRASWPDRLVELVDLWRHVPPSREDFPQTLEMFTAASYAYILYGMGFQTLARATAKRAADQTRAGRVLDEIAARSARYVAGLPTNRQLLDHIHGDGLHRTSEAL